MEEKKVIINGLEVGYRIGGSTDASLPAGRQVLILHGWGSRGERWEKTAELLMKKGVMAIIPDLPGFGRSQKPLAVWGLDEYCNFLERFIENLNLEKFYLLGHSFGGALAAKYSLNFPGKAKKLFLVASACVRKKSLKKQILFLVSKFFKIFSFLPFYSYLRKGFYKFIVRKSDYHNTEGIMRESYLRIIGEDLSDKLPLIEIPAVIIWGEKDRITTLNEAKFIKDKIENSKLIIIKEGDHDLEQKMPEILAEKILENID